MAFGLADRGQERSNDLLGAHGFRFASNRAKRLPQMSSRVGPDLSDEDDVARGNPRGRSQHLSNLPLGRHPRPQCPSDRERSSRLFFLPRGTSAEIEFESGGGCVLRGLPSGFASRKKREGGRQSQFRERHHLVRGRIPNLPSAARWGRRRSNSLFCGSITPFFSEPNPNFWNPTRANRMPGNGGIRRRSVSITPGI